MSSALSKFDFRKPLILTSNIFYHYLQKYNSEKNAFEVSKEESSLTAWARKIFSCKILNFANVNIDQTALYPGRVVLSKNAPRRKVKFPTA